MDRAERIGLGTALAGHVALFGVLSLGFLSHPRPLPRISEPMEVSLDGPVAPLSAAPAPAKEAPAPSEAPDQGEPEDAAPPPAPAPEPSPVPRKAAPQPTPAPAPKPVPRPPEPKPVPAPKPTPAPKAAPKAQPAPAKAAAPAKPATTRSRLSPDFLKDLPDTGNGKSASSAKPRATGSRLGKDFLKGIADSPGKASAPRAAMTGADMASLAALLRKQLKDNWSAPAGTGVSELTTSLRVRLNRDGSLAAPPELIGTTGVTDANRIYVRQHQDAARRAVARAAPFKGLPAEFYENWKLLDPLNFDNRLSQ